MAVVNRLLAAVLGVALAAVGVVLIVETAAAAFERGPVIFDRQRLAQEMDGLSWDDPVVLGVLLALLLIGAVLLLIQLLPRPPETLPLRGETDRSAAIDRRALTSRVSKVALADPEVATARATVTGSGARVRARAIPGADLGGVRQRLRQQVDETLDSYQLSPRPTTRVTVSRSREPVQ